MTYDFGQLRSDVANWQQSRSRTDLDMISSKIQYLPIHEARAMSDYLKSIIYRTPFTIKELIDSLEWTRYDIQVNRSIEAFDSFDKFIESSETITYILNAQYENTVIRFDRSVKDLKTIYTNDSITDSHNYIMPFEIFIQVCLRVLGRSFEDLTDFLITQGGVRAYLNGQPDSEWWYEADFEITEQILGCERLFAPNDYTRAGETHQQKINRLTSNRFHNRRMALNMTPLTLVGLSKNYDLAAKSISAYNKDPDHVKASWLSIALCEWDSQLENNLQQALLKYVNEHLIIR